jgi:CRISPR-associated protein (TIGR02710 family)
MVVLFMTIGTGVGPHPEAGASLAHGLAFSIHQHHPDRIVCFVSEESQQTVPKIEKIYATVAKGELFPHSELVILPRIDDFAGCFEKIHNTLMRFKSERVIFDCTSGTKVMTMAAGMVSLLEHCDQYYITGRRKDGVIIDGTEQIIQQSLYPVYDRLLLEKAIHHFNHHHYAFAIEVLDEIVALEEKKHYRKIFDAYVLWDRFDHSGAYALLRNVPDPKINVNRGALGKLVNPKNTRYRSLFLLADLLNNAKRRMDEGRFDDAVGRLYRSVELMMQLALLERGLDDIDNKVKIDQVRLKIKDHEALTRLEGQAHADGALLLGVEGKVNLLGLLGDIQMQTFYNNLKTLLTKRNESILAHGLNPVDKSTADQLYNRVRTEAIEVFKIGPHLIELQFPQL